MLAPLWFARFPQRINYYNNFSWPIFFVLFFIVTSLYDCITINYTSILKMDNTYQTTFLNIVI